MPLDLIAFDADDTLWHHERYFKLTESRVRELLRPYAEPHHLSEHLLAAERRNIAHYGFGVKGFVLSMIETAVDVTDGRVPGSVIGELLDAGREMLRHPIEPLPHVEATLDSLAGRYRLILITKGDLFDQERKLALSGLRDRFEAVEIVSEKDEATYRRLFGKHGTAPEAAMMIGNSMTSDVLPPLAAGAYAVHVPSEHVWALDRHDDAIESTRFFRIPDLSQLPELAARLR